MASAQVFINKKKKHEKLAKNPEISKKRILESFLHTTGCLVLERGAWCSKERLFQLEDLNF